MFYFCTYFDKHYLTRGLALYRSLREHCPEFRLWVLCMDDTYNTLTELNLPGVYLISLKEFEQNDEALRIAKTNRSLIEYYFTCTPSLPLYILNHYPEVDLITYLDADLFFFSNPVVLFEEMKNASIAIIAHRFPAKLKNLEIRGIYNVGWLSFRRDVNGLDCLQWWRDRCIEWCYDRTENGKFADQKYLDDWTSRFQKVVVLEHKGANVAPWNLGNYHLSCQHRNSLTVDDQPLIFFHFHGLKEIVSWCYDPRWRNYGEAPSLLLRRQVYTPYIKVLLDLRHRMLLSFDARPISGLNRLGLNQQKIPCIRTRFIVNQFRRLLSICKNIVTGEYIFVIAK